MHIPEHLLYSQDHDWIHVEEGIATVGITDYAQDMLGEIVYVNVVDVGTLVERNEPFGELESIKADSDLLAPLSGTVIDANQLLDDEQENVNTDPYGTGWIVRVLIEDASQLKDLITAGDYLASLEAER